MRYVLASLALAKAFRFDTYGHRQSKVLVVLNEKEVMCSPHMPAGSSLEERAELLKSQVYTESEILNVITNNNLDL